MSERALEREAARQLDVMREGSVAFHGEEDLRPRLVAALEEQRPLRIKLGMDPSAPDLHLGHTVVLNKLKRMQDLGHTPIFLVGDFTARIGDPSGKNKTRPALSVDTVEQNAKTYVEQVARILDVDHAEVRFNSEWMEDLSPADMVRLCSHYTVARLLERDDFAKRYRAGEPIAVHEFLYPFVQSYDSVALRADVELGGTDQTFNLLMGREIQRDYGQPPQAVITHPLLVGTDGAKMSKSLGNGIGITDPPDEMFGKVMSVSDALMLEYYDLLHDGRWEALSSLRQAFRDGEGDPMEFKLGLARSLVERFAGAEAARAAADHFRNVVQGKQTPKDLEEIRCETGPSGEIGLLELLERLELITSRSEGRRLVGQGAVRVDGEVVADPTLRLSPGCFLLKVGKRRFAQVRLS
ncbi:MAG: tyrosine--tRNA ligase [Deltaproteobacteria bacterium]|jgi:tyrosyl-tRNA synthetase|nr:tyrosine--tRNA ligase [Deltaproteobacteria bacterium]MBW2543718.1 tyrosine--tRNA ligase [Deltaproteobacteria bacterium]